MRDAHTGRCAFGGITSGVRKNQHLLRLVEFVYRTLPLWRDDPERPAAKNETALNETLCGLLDIRAKTECPLFHFMHEASATGRRRLDLAAKPDTPVTLFARTYGKYDTVLAIEGKRLPAPPPKKREREYVSNFSECSGGIQRFKCSEHGAGLPVSVLVAYIQRGSAPDWFATINTWLAELADRRAEDGLVWQREEALTAFEYDGRARTSRSVSRHPRVVRSPSLPVPVTLYHLWIEMTPA